MAMANNGMTRRELLKAGAAAATTATAFAAPARADAPPPTAITPNLVAAATKEGSVVWYTSVDLPVAEKIAHAFQDKYPGIAVRVERTGAERLFQRLEQEYSSGIHAVDVVNSSDASQLIVWKGDGILEPFVPEDVAKYYPPQHKDLDGQFASFRIGLAVIGYNTNLVKAADAPKSYADLLDPKWKGKLVKAHPGYSGTIMTATFQITRDLGWSYLEKLAQQNVMQVQSSSDPPKKLELGERAVMVDGNEYDMFNLIEASKPVAIVYPTEGTPLIVGPNALFKAAPNPNGARLFQCYCFTAEAQQLIIDVGGLRSAHPQTKEPAGRTPFSQIKTFKDDPAGVLRDAEAIKARYVKIFHV
jgi:iron(III) transport system substrate-binding protein